jgi:hypothetical protein
MYEPRKSGRHARTCECAMASSTGQSSSDRLVSCIALAAVHNSPSPCPSSSPLSSEVTCGTARHQTRTPFPHPVSNRGGALLKKCAVPPPFPHAVPQVILVSRKPLVHFQAGRPTWRLSLPFLCFACSGSSADGLPQVRVVRSSWAPYWSGTSLPTPTIAGGSPSQARRSQWSNFARYASSQIRMSSR